MTFQHLLSPLLLLQSGTSFPLIFIHIKCSNAITESEPEREARKQRQNKAWLKKQAVVAGSLAWPSDTRTAFPWDVENRNSMCVSCFLPSENVGIVSIFSSKGDHNHLCIDYRRLFCMKHAVSRSGEVTWATVNKSTAHLPQVLCGKEHHKQIIRAKQIHQTQQWEEC